MGTATLIVLVGPPGAGKTTLRAVWPEAVVVSLDENRARVAPCGCSANQDPAVRVAAVAMAFTAARAALTAGRTVVWDATSAVPADRRALLRLATETGADAHAVVVLPPLPLVLARNARRDPHRCWCGYARRVPDTVVTAMHRAIEHALPGLPGEGWRQVSRARTTPAGGEGAGRITSGSHRIESEGSA